MFTRTRNGKKTKAFVVAAVAKQAVTAARGIPPVVLSIWATRREEDFLEGRNNTNAVTLEH